MGKFKEFFKEYKWTIIGGLGIGVCAAICGNALYNHFSATQVPVNGVFAPTAASQIPISPASQPRTMVAPQPRAAIAPPPKATVVSQPTIAVVPQPTIVTEPQTITPIVSQLVDASAEVDTRPYIWHEESHFVNAHDRHLSDGRVIPISSYVKKTGGNV